MKIQRRYPYNRKELRDTLEFYNYKCNERGKNEFFQRNGGIPIPPTEEGIDQYEDILKASCSYKLSRKEFIQMMLIYRKWYEMNGKTESISAINKLIGDRKLFNRMVFVYDGSYATKKVRFELDGRVYVSCIDYCQDNMISFRKAINKMYGNYDFIMIHVKRISSIEEIKEDIRWHKEMNELDYA